MVVYHPEPRLDGGIPDSEVRRRGCRSAIEQGGQTGKVMGGLSRLQRCAVCKTSQSRWPGGEGAVFLARSRNNQVDVTGTPCTGEKVLFHFAHTNTVNLELTEFLADNVISTYLLLKQDRS